MLFQKRLIDSPLIHFGLGDQRQADVARIIWPNGMAQAEFELKGDQTFVAEQRLKGSCPWLFAFDGKQMSFVKDCPPWSPALGLHINAQVTAGIEQVEEWFKIPGAQLAPRDGVYDLRVTCELWETYYIDRYALLVVDHPKGTEIYTDERFSIPPPPLAIFATGEPRPFGRAIDDRGADVTAIIRELDDRYLDAGRGQYQGVSRDHYVELELSSEAPIDGQLWIIGDGFVHPTDGTVNIAMSQPAGYVPPHGLSLEVPDGKGGWRVANAALGFPAGKKKTVLIDLRGAFPAGTAVADRRLRLRTNMEVYWDRLEWAVGLPDSKFEVHKLDKPSAELLYRGFSKTAQAGESSPELPDYNSLYGTGQRWRDLVGYFTRYGDITELLAEADDRIVITNAGDEIRLKFPAQPPPKDGWLRDFVLIGNGWIKDGDLNSTFSKTVLPLPYATMREYTRPPGNLEDDPAYKNHSQDWQEYHTRYVTPDRFQRALVPK